MKMTKLLVIMTIFGLTEVAIVHSEENSAVVSKHNFWIGMGAGYSAPINSLPTVMAYGTYGSNNHLLTLRYIRNREFAVFQDSPQEIINDIGFMYGRKLLNKKHVFISINGGVSYITGTIRGRLISSGCFTSVHAPVDVSTIGFPLESQLVLTPFKHVGFSLNCFGNLNPESSYIGAGLSLLVGKF